MTPVTLTIDGRRITLPGGHNYLASRPMAVAGRRVYPVTITVNDRDSEDRSVAMRIGGMGMEAADAFLAAFNNGSISLAGRDWPEQEAVAE